MAMDAEHDSGMVTGEGDFDVVMRGYHRHQVEEFVTRTRSELGDLEQRLAVSRRETERVRKELAAARSELAATQQSAKPAHAAVSERLSQILRLAAEEADQEKAAAEATIAEMRAEAAAQVDRLRTEAGAESERLLTSAREQSERTLSDARDEASRLLTTSREEASRLHTSSREEASRLVASSREEAERTVSSAKEHAHRVVSAAERRAVAVTDVANRRLSAMTERHTQTVERLSEIREALVGLLAEEASTASLEDEVHQIAGPPFEPADRAAARADGDAGTAEPAPETGEAPAAGEESPAGAVPAAGPAVPAGEDRDRAATAPDPVRAPQANPFMRTSAPRLVPSTDTEPGPGSEAATAPVVSVRPAAPGSGSPEDEAPAEPGARPALRVDPAADVLERTDDGESVSTGPRST